MTIDDPYKPDPGFPELFAPEEIAPPTPLEHAKPEEPPFVTIQRDYQRVAKAIELMWGSRELDVYMRRLIVDDRGGRAGFPPEVLAAIIKLYNQHTAQFRFKTTLPNASDTWADDDPLVRRREKEEKPLGSGWTEQRKKS